MNKEFLFAVLFFLGLVSPYAHAEKIYLDPGTEVIVWDVPTTVVCTEKTAFRRYCRCSIGGLEGQWTLELVLEGNGTTDNLATYSSQERCESQLDHNPACLP